VNGRALMALQVSDRVWGYSTNKTAQAKASFVSLRSFAWLRALV
jgi:hypothetical protein